jgi:hypothetical protein
LRLEDLRGAKKGRRTMTLTGRSARWRISRTFLLALGLGLEGVVVSGCASGLEEVRSENRGRLFRLEVGQSREQVLDAMGRDSLTIAASGLRTVAIPRPYDTETHTAAGSVWEILYYPGALDDTRLPLEDSELVPVVLRDDQLAGWGWTYLNDLTARLGIERDGPRAPREEDAGG